ncbi:Kinesin-like KIFC3, partial [Opisthocomus hoazin]
ARLQREAEEMRAKLAELDLEVQQKTNRLAEVELRLKDSLAERAEEEERLSRRLRDSQETIASLKSQPQQIKYIIKTVEVESAKAKQALCESQSRNQYLHEQVGMQRQGLKEMEQQLQSSQKTAAQLRAQIVMYEAELEQAHGQMLEEMQAMEEEKNCAIEEAFSRAQVEMKAVHENLAGESTRRAGGVAGPPALRTLTHDYNSLKRQVRDFPLLLQETLRSARAEVGTPGPPPWLPPHASVGDAGVGSLRRCSPSPLRSARPSRRCTEPTRSCCQRNIRVFGRVRPITKEDGEGPEVANAVTFDANNDAVLHLLHKGKQVSFELDKVFPPQASQEEVFEEVQALVTSCIDGYNVCIFAYGQTGAGKTYTMEGTAANPGINQRALQLLFSEVGDKAADWDYAISVSAAEIYKEEVITPMDQTPCGALMLGLCPQGSPGHGRGCGGFGVCWAHPPPRVLRAPSNLALKALGMGDELGGPRSCPPRLPVGAVPVGTVGSNSLGHRPGRRWMGLAREQRGNNSTSPGWGVRGGAGSWHGDFLPASACPQVSPAEKNTSETLCSLKFAERVRSVELGPVSRKAELGSWLNQEQLEQTGCPCPSPSGRSHASPSPRQPSGRAASIRRQLQTS